MKDAKETT